MELDKVIKATDAPSPEATVGTSIHLVIVDFDLGKAALEIDLEERRDLWSNTVAASWPIGRFGTAKASSAAGPTSSELRQLTPLI